MRRHRPRPVLACLVSLIWLLAAVLPTVTYAQMMRTGQTSVLTELPSTEVCSTSSQDSSDPSQDRSAHHLDHCGMCLPHAGAAGLPPGLPTQTAPMHSQTSEVPALYLQSPRPLFAWATPALRGPPQA